METEKVELTRRTTTWWNSPQVYAESTWYLAARSYWPDFVFYTTRDQKVVHWGLAVDELFVLEQHEFATVIRDFVSQRISMEVKTQLLQVVPLPDIHEQDGEDDIYIYIYILIDELPLQSEIPVMVSLWVQEADRSPELSAHRLPTRVETATLLEQYGLHEVCMHRLYSCTVSHFQAELPRMVAWKPFPGMKIDIRVRMLQDEESCEGVEQSNMTDFHENNPNGTAEEDFAFLLQIELPREPLQRCHVTSFAYLPPPGNPNPDEMETLWWSSDMNALDIWMLEDGKIYVLDVHDERVSLPLSKLLGGTRPVPTPCRAPSGSPHIPKTTHLPMPDFQPFWDSIFQNRVLPQVEWQSILGILPADVMSMKISRRLSWSGPQCWERSGYIQMAQTPKMKNSNQRGVLLPSHFWVKKLFCLELIMDWCTLSP